MSSPPLPLLTETLKLNTGALIPRIGLGVFQAKKQEGYNATLNAIRLGYRHIDTATFYGNEKEIGRAVRDSGVKREDIFVTTKVWIDEFGYDATLASAQRSLKALDIGYIDLLLLHAPVEKQRLDSYKALEECLKTGLCKAIGVSNYGKHHMEELLQHCNVLPAVNQIELHPFVYPDVIPLCQSKGILIEAYSPLTKGQRLKHPAMMKYAEKYKRSVAQIMIRWCYQHDFVVLPKSVHPERQIENATLDFEISKEDMEAMDSAALKEQWHCTWNPLEWA